MDLIVVYMLIGLNTGKFSEELHVTSHATKDKCIAAAYEQNWEDWACYPTVIPATGETIVNDHAMKFGEGKE